MKEKNFQSKFMRWIEAYWHTDKSARFELKFVDLSKNKRLNFKNSLPDHQRRALSAKRHMFKIPDAGYQNPYDCYHITGKGYLVIQFWKPRCDHFYMVEIEKILSMIETGEKSIDEETCVRFGIKCYF